MAGREHVVELLSIGRAVPFEYHHDDRTFRFGAEDGSPDDISHYGYLHSAEGVTVRNVEEWETSHSFLITRHPISTAIGREAIESIWSGRLENEVREVMADVLAEQLGTIKMAERNRWLELGSFGTQKLSAGEVSVQTMGICACLGVDYTVHDSWRCVGFSEYTPHNIDNRAQRASVLAGLGHIAHTANRYINGAS